MDVPADFGVDSLYFEFYGINPLKDGLARVFAVFLNSVSKLAGVDYSSPLIVRDENMSADLALNDYDDSGIRHSRMLCLECLVTIIATVVAAIATLNIVYKRFS